MALDSDSKEQCSVLWPLYTGAAEYDALTGPGTITFVVIQSGPLFWRGQQQHELFKKMKLRAELVNDFTQ